MGIWNRIFQRDEASELTSSAQFGRFSDAYKMVERYAHWDRALQHFDDEAFHDVILELFAYLQNDESDNAFVHQNSGNLDFYLIQGSKKLVGQCIDNRLVVTANIVSGESYSTGLLRRLLDKNYALNYCRFALDDQNQLTAIFDSFLQDSNPYKLYFGLKELAIQADKIDDLILSEFKGMKPRDAGHTRPVTNEIIKIKSDFYYLKLKGLKNDLEHGFLKKARDPNIIIYSILSVFYKLDYLLVPHGRSTEYIEHAHKEYFSDGTRPVELRVASLMTAVDELLLIPDDELCKEWYEVIYTFGINPPIDLYQAHTKLQTEIKKIEWYIENDEYDHARVVTGFIIGYILFDYSVDHLLKDLLTIYYRVTNEAFFHQLGFQSNFVSDKGKLRKKQIETVIKQIIERHESTFHIVKIPIEQLDYKDVHRFGLSLLSMLLASSFSALEVRT